MSPFVVVWFLNNTIIYVCLYTYCLSLLLFVASWSLSMLKLSCLLNLSTSTQKFCITCVVPISANWRSQFTTYTTQPNEQRWINRLTPSTTNHDPANDGPRPWTRTHIHMSPRARYTRTKPHVHTNSEHKGARATNRARTPRAPWTHEPGRRMRRIMRRKQMPKFPPREAKTPKMRPPSFYR